MIEKGANVNAVDSLGETILFKAETPEITKILLENGADVKIINKNQETALHQAIKRNNLQQIMKLINAGVDIEVKNIDNKTAFDLVKDKTISDFLRKIF